LTLGTAKRVLFCAAVGLVPAAAHAQVWAVSAIAGRTVNDPLAARVPAENGSLEVRYTGADERLWAYASAGAPLGSPGPAWGTAGAGRILPLAPFAGGSLALAGNGDLYGYAASSGRSAGGGGTVSLGPVLTLDRGRMRAELRTAALGTLEQIGDSSSWRVMSDNGVRLIAGADGPVQLAADARYLRASEGGYTWAGASALLARARGSAWAYAGRWLSSGFPAPATGFGAGGTLRIASGLDAGVSWAQEPTDPVYFTAARRSWSVQLTRRFGGRPAATGAAPALPSVSVPVLPLTLDQRVEISVPAADAGESPSIVGEFTQWQPVPMTRDGDRWIVTLPIAPGTYHYALRAPDGRIFVPAGLPRVDDGFGGTSTVLVVR
jgi:hypothetical protein